MNYGELKTAVVGWLKRSDAAAIIPTLVVLAEARLSRELRLRAQLVLTRADLLKHRVEFAVHCIRRS